jgi:hypothetical protein
MKAVYRVQWMVSLHMHLLASWLVHGLLAWFIRSLCGEKDRGRCSTLDWWFTLLVLFDVCCPHLLVRSAQAREKNDIWKDGKWKFRNQWSRTGPNILYEKACLLLW